MLDLSTLSDRFLRLTIAILAIAWFIIAGNVCAEPAEPRPPSGPERLLTHLCLEGEAVLSAHLAFVETKLELRDDQRLAYSSFEAAVRKAVQPVRDLCTAGIPRSESDLPSRLRVANRIGTALLATETGVISALEGLYPRLDDAQRRTLDALPPGFGIMRLIGPPHAYGPGDFRSPPPL